MPPGDAVGWRHGRNVEHTERFGARDGRDASTPIRFGAADLTWLVGSQRQAKIAGLLRHIRRQGASTHEQGVLTTGHAAGDVGHDHAMTMNQVIGGLRLRDFLM